MSKSKAEHIAQIKANRELDLLKSVISTRVSVAMGGLDFKSPEIPSLSYRGQSTKLPSRVSPDLPSSAAGAAKKVNTYTGTAMLGVAVMHKSNAITSSVKKTLSQSLLCGDSRLD